MNLSILNENQLDGVTTTSKYTRIVAGAGSGKTRVLTYRIAYLLENNLASPYSILGITFTNKAAAEIKNRVMDLVDGSYDMSLCTIHSWCARFLRRECKYISYPKNFIILDEDDTLKIIKDIFVSMDKPKNDPLIKKCINWICGKKMIGIQYKDIQNENYPNSEMRMFLDVFKKYTEKLESMYAFDFDDLLLKTIEILENEDNGVAYFYRSRISHILVDEFQDINDVQFHLITLLMNQDTELYVVGDPDQTIYTWRGANNDIIMNFGKSLSQLFEDVEVKTIILNKNYRSTKKILQCANTLISKNEDRVKKDLLSMQDDGADVAVFSAFKSQDEASYIVNNIKDLYLNKIPYKKIAILYRANYLSREIESQCNLRAIPYKVYGGMKFFQRKEIKDVISYFTLLLNPEADTAFERIINVPKRNIGEASVDKLKEAAQNEGQSLYHFILESDNIPLTGSKKVALKSLVKLLEKTKEKIDNAEEKTSIPDILEQLLIDVDYERELNEDEDKKDDRKENIQELLISMRSYFSSVNNPSFDEFIENCALQSSQDEVVDGDFVTLMTVHTAKGLEFDYVFVYGLNDGVFPSRRAVEESRKGLEEERRLAYVAFTRAKKKLYLTYNNDFSYMMNEKLMVSRFIREAGLIKKEEPKSRFINENVWSAYRKVDKPKPVNKPVVPINKTNGIKDWKVHDKVIHDAFGIGEVVELKGTLIVVSFKDEKFGKKTLLANHHMIKRLYN